MLLSFAFLYAGKIESVVFDRGNGLFQVQKTTIICRKETQNYRMKDIHQVTAYKRGHSGVNVYTVHYKMIVEFTNMPPVKILESQN